MMRTRMGCVLSCFVAAATLLAACGSSGGGSEANASGGHAANSPAGTSAPSSDKSPIKVMATGTISSSNVSYPEAAAGVRAAAEAINAAGGVSGHPIKVVECNDSLDPNKAAACVQQAADEKVVALVGGISLFSAQLWPKLKAADIPWVGITAISADQATDPLAYPVSASSPGIYTENGRLAVERGGKRVVLVRNENPQAAYVLGFAKEGVADAGGSIVKTVTSKIGSTDTSSAAAQVIAARPDGVICGCNEGDAGRMVRSLRQAGFKGAIVASTSSFSPTDFKSLGAFAENVYGASDVPLPNDPNAKAWVEEMKKYEPSAQLNSVSADGWIAVHVVADLLKGQSSLTSKTLIEALNSAPAISTGLQGDKTFSFSEEGPLKDAPRIVNLDVIDLVVRSGAWTALTGEFKSAVAG